MESIINTKLGTHRGKRRIWIEGMKLLNGGYQAGLRFNIESDEGTLKIIPDREGKYTVSRRLRNGKTLPIIDISVDIIAKMFEGIECLTIRICEKVIEITGEYQQIQIVKRESKVLEKLKNGFPLSSFCLFHGGGILSSAI
ncbi:DNA cytosine methyltransferase, partial [Vibrio anguillarum]|nr:DNA cytosine methyltransferase [Vibrio anguillarum]